MTAPDHDPEGPDPREAPGDAAEAAGIVDQQAVAVQAIKEAEDEEGESEPTETPTAGSPS
jgi:hypothetical protein